MRDAPAWKGLDTRLKPVFLGYERTERMVSALLARALEWRPDSVAGIARGGLVPATMAATMLGLPIACIAYDRRAERASWIGPPAPGRRLLVVDDGCSSGRTMAGVRAALIGEERDCLTLAVVHDPDHTAYIPDLSHPMRALWRFPWERGEAAPSARAVRAGDPDRLAAAGEMAAEAPFLGIDLEAALLRRNLADPLAALPFFAPGRAVVVASLSERAGAEAAAWLGRWGHAGLPLECRAEAAPADAASIARYKAAVATRWGCTHFVESEPRQAILVAAAAPHLVVIWWAEDGAGHVVSAAAEPEAGALTPRP